MIFKNRKFAFFVIAAFILLCLNTFAKAQASPLKVQISGNGKQAIVFIPGFGCSGDVWKETLPFFEKDFKCYTLTMPGVAGVAPEKVATIAVWEADIASYLQQNKIEKAIIVGHSMGGGLAMLLAADHPELVSKIVVVDALPCLAAVRNPAFKSKENNDCSQIVTMMTGMSDSQYYQMQLKTMPQLVADSTRVPLIAQWSVSSDRKTLGNIYCDFLNTDMRERIATIKCPALIMLEPSFAGIKTTIDEQFKNMKTADLEYATKGLHFIMYDDPHWYNEHIRAFINK